MNHLKIQTLLLIIYSYNSFGQTDTLAGRKEESAKIAISDSITIEFVELNYGNVKINRQRQVISSSSPSGTSYRSNKWVFTETTDEIPALPGVKFGVEWKVTSTGSGSIPIRIIWRFPRKMYNNENKAFSFYSSTIHPKLNSPQCSGYELEHTYEIIPGVWWFEAYYRNKLIYKRKFIVKEVL